MIALLMNKLEPKVFISHSSIDDSVTRHLEDWLTRLGFTCWVYYQDPDPNFRRSIQRAIESHDYFLLVSSRNAYEESIEVVPEILWAHKHRRQICIYKLDDCAFPEGIAYLLSRTKWVDANTHNANTFAVLAMQMLLSLGLEDDIVNLKIAKIKNDINAQQEEEAKREKLRLEKWLDKLWTYRYDYELKRSRTLNTWDKRKLACHGDELGISEGDRIKLLRQYKRDLRTFKKVISRVLSSNRLDKRDIKELEQARLDCCIPLKEAKCLVQEELSKYSDIITLTKGAAALDSWITSMIKDLIEWSKASSAHSGSKGNDLIEGDAPVSLLDNTSTEAVSVQFRDQDQCMANAAGRNQTPQVNISPKDHADVDQKSPKRVFHIAVKCHLQWAISAEKIGRCWLRRIEMRADCLYFWGFGRDLTLLLQDIESIQVNASAMEIRLRDHSSDVEINCFGDEMLSTDLINYFSSRGICIIYSLGKPSRSGQDIISDRCCEDGHRAFCEFKKPRSESEILANNSSVMPDLLPLANGLEPGLAETMVARILDAFRDADAGLFKTLSYYAKDKAARARTLRNHGLQKHSIHDIYLFINVSLFRSKNGILVCDSLLSIKEFFEKPVHFELFSPLSGALTLDAEVTDNTKIRIVVKRETCQVDGKIETRTLQVFNLDTSNSLLTRPFYKDLVEHELPALVRSLGFIQKRGLEVD